MDQAGGIGVRADDRDELRHELHQLLSERAFQFGDFVLSSGRHSSFYFDGRKVTLDGRGLHLVSRLILDRCHSLNAEVIAGLTLGADPIIAGVIALSGAEDATPLRGTIVRKQSKDHGTGQRLEGPPLLAGTRVVLVDDTTTTGTSYISAAQAVRQTGAEILEAIAIVDREEGARDELAKHGMPLFALFARSEFAAPASAS